MSFSPILRGTDSMTFASFSHQTPPRRKKRQRMEEDSSPLPISETGEDKGDQGVEEGQGRRSEGDTGDGLGGPEEDQDFAPLSKKIRGASPQLPSGRKRRSGLGSASPLVFRRLSEGIQAPPAVVMKNWSCGACTYTNSALLPYCEMCATPRFEKAGSSGFDRSGSEIDGFDRTGPGSCGSDITGGDGQLLAPKSPCLVISSSDEDADPSPSLPLPAPGREDSEETGGEGESQKERCEGAQSPGSTAPDRHTDESICDSADSSLPLYESLQFCASYNSDRIHLYTKEGIPLNCNFIPMDIKLDIWEDLPEAFGRQENRRQVQRFVREWSSLTSTKQRVVRRSGRLFHSPVLTLNDLTSAQRRQSITKRFLTKEDVAQASMSRAQQEGGSVRTVTPETFFAKRTPAKMADSTLDKGLGGCGSPPQTGYLQAVDSGGNPLCLSCQQPCGPAASWDGRFCGRACQEEFQVRSSQSYMRMRVLEAERGVCQTCGLNAHQLFLSVRDAPPTSRKEMLENTWLSQLSLKELNEMIRNPVEGQFWQVDHIRPVYSGGGQCSLDNLQTLCTVCHKERTSLQAKERSQMKKGLAASKVASDITRFLIRK
ncbi:hypothetical protein GJAV_G00211030 [Gymnothorax javanicus]|nr:hypothetical protein GJAV_G00211030 [Gymnothorax javanicus]